MKRTIKWQILWKLIWSGYAPKIRGRLIREIAMPPNISAAQHVMTLPMPTKTDVPMTKVEVRLVLISIVDGKCEPVTSLVSC